MKRFILFVFSLVLVGFSLSTLRRFTVIFTCLWIFGLIVFVDSIPKTTPDESADAIIVFTGGPDRVKVGETLFKEKRGWYLFISGVHPSAHLQDLLNIPEIDRPRVTLDTRSHDTVANVEESSRWVQQCRFHRILLVTAHYHLPRAIMLFHRELPELTIIPYPVVTQEFKASLWWLNVSTLVKFLREYHKFLWAQVF